MSEKEMNVYVSKDESVDILPLLDFIKNRDWDSIVGNFGDKVSMLINGSPVSGVSKEEIADRFDRYFDTDFMYDINDICLHISFTTANSFDEEAFQLFLRSLGASKVETMLYESGVGEYTFLLNDEYFDEYSDNDWQWLEEPLTVVEKYVVFTGKLVSGSREEIEEMAEDYGAVVQKSVNSKTNYLIIGKNVGDKKLSKAKELGITIITEKEFLVSIGEYC